MNLFSASEDVVHLFSQKRCAGPIKCQCTENQVRKTQAAATSENFSLEMKRMSERLQTIPEGSRETWAALHKKFGKVPNLFATFAQHAQRDSEAAVGLFRSRYGLEKKVYRCSAF